MNFLNLDGKLFLIFGIANKKSLAFFIAKTLTELNAKVILSVQTNTIKNSIQKYFPNIDIYVCDVEKDDQIQNLKISIPLTNKLDGVVHSIAYANYSNKEAKFFETEKTDFIQAIDISCFSLINIAKTFKNFLKKDASVVTISISSTKIAVENYGYMSPIKAALESTVCFLAKSFSSFSNVRFNTVASGPLKTTASAGIPDFVDSYTFSEKATLRHASLKTQEVANTVIFLLSSCSSGINAQKIIVDAGMSINYFDKEIIKNNK